MDLVQVLSDALPGARRELALQAVIIGLGLRHRRPEAFGRPESLRVLAAAIFPGASDLFDGAPGPLEHRLGRLELLRGRIRVAGPERRDGSGMGAVRRRERLVRIAARLVEPQALRPVLGHLSLQPLERRGELLCVLGQPPDTLRAGDEGLASCADGFQHRAGTDGVRGDERAGPVDLRGDGGHLLLVRRDRQSELPDHLDLGVDLGLHRVHGFQLGSRRLVRLVEPIHIGGAGLGSCVDRLERTFLFQHRLGVMQGLPLEGGCDAEGQLLGPVERVHHLEPSIPEFAHGLLDARVEGRGLAGHGRLEVRIRRGQELEPFLERIEAIHDVGCAGSDLLDPLIQAAPGTAVDHPETADDGRQDDEERKAEPDREVPARRPIRWVGDDHGHAGLGLRGSGCGRVTAFSAVAVRRLVVVMGGDPLLGLIEQGGDGLRVSPARDDVEESGGFDHLLMNTLSAAGPVR